MLYQLVERRSISQIQAQEMASLLEDFSSMKCVLTFREGTFEQFQIHVQNSKRISANQLPINIWEEACRREDWKALLTSVGFIGLVLSIFVFTVTMVASAVSRSVAPFVDPVSFWQAEGAGRSAAQVIFGLLLASPLNGFLSNYFGDVAYWGTYDENDTKYEKRRAVLDLCTDTLEYIVQQKACARMIIAAHSLGSRVTYESLLYMNYRRLARNKNNETSDTQDLEKIKHLITYGSPIDKMHYFMESRSGFSRHYERNYTKLTGDTSKMPFKKNGKPNILWVNFHSSGDAISGPIQTPNDLSDFTPMIFNIPVVNYDNINLGKNHTGYFDNAVVVSWLHQVITDPTIDRDPLTGAVSTLPGESNGVSAHKSATDRMYAGVLFYPLAVLAALITGVLNAPLLAFLAWAVSVVLLGVMVWNIVGRSRHHANLF